MCIDFLQKASCKSSSILQASLARLIASSAHHWSAKHWVTKIATNSTTAKLSACMLSLRMISAPYSYVGMPATIAAH